ncbi:MAG: isoprenoid biosynthesis glyoxalase ElbB [Bacteroidales bacterium]|nr:isoprenoid biosynthesis glyoxalase ElbB [Bacteroidales bacterium]
MKKFAIILAGNGVYDGAEIQEVVLTMLAIKQQSCDYQCFAPDIPQHHVINHLNGEEMNETRNVLIESARIARGDIKNLSEFNVYDFDALIFPGGFGVAKNLCSIAFDGAKASVNEEVSKAVIKMHKNKKPIGALCIAPALIAKIIGNGLNVTVGQDEATANTIEQMGAIHIETDHGDVVLDEENLIFTSPCYMLDANISQIYDGAYNTVEAMIKMMD